VRFEDVEGLILVRATLTSVAGRDTSGDFVLDTGAGSLGIDLELARALGLVTGGAGVGATGHTGRPLPRLALGTLEIDQVAPVLVLDIAMIRRVTGRRILGILGPALFARRVLVLDYREQTLAMLPPEPGGRAEGLRIALSREARAVPFRLVGDGKVVLRGRIGSSGAAPPAGWLDLIVDTGATKSVFFREALDRHVPGWTTWPAMRGLSGRTLVGDSRTRIVRVPEIRLDARGDDVLRSDMAAAVIEGDLGRMVSLTVGEPIDGLLGYTFFKHFRVALDYAGRRMWLDPAHGAVPDRPHEYCHVGLQLEEFDGVLRVVGVVEGSPADQAEILKGDEMIALDGEEVAELDVVTVARRLRGPPGSAVSLTLRRGDREWSRRLVRRCLL
jgi:hypothetical protein